LWTTLTLIHISPAVRSMQCLMGVPHGFGREGSCNA
jgi:hypothetical protein